MTHPDQPSGAPERPASAQGSDDTAPIPWARTTTMPTVPAASRVQASGPVTTAAAVPPAPASAPDVTAASAPALDVSRVSLRSGSDSRKARSAGEVINTSPMASSRMQSTLRACFHASRELI